MPATSTITPTGNAMIDGVLSGTKWAVSNFTFSFPTSGSYYEAGYGSGEPTKGFEAFNATQQSVARNVLNQYSAVANISFTEISETLTKHADLRFAESDGPSTAWSYYPSTRAEGGDAWFNKADYNTPAKGNYAYATFLHEIGHSFGLKHPHEVSGAFAAMPVGYDSMEYTVLSYRSYVGASTTTGYTNETWGYAQSLMMADLAGLQKMYGANYNTNSGNTTYSWSPTTGEMFVNGVGQGAPGGNKIFLTVWDGGGVDTYDFASYASNLSIDLQPGAWSTTSAAQLARLHSDGSKIAAGSIANALLYNGDVRSLVENATGGSGLDVLKGNVAHNLLKGGGGDDQLTGGAGNDTLKGDAGSDVAIFSGSRSDYSVTALADGSLQISDKRTGTPDGTDTVWDLESFQFADRIYALSELAGNAQSASTGDLDVLVADASYLAQNPDVLAAGVDPDVHYAQYGWREGRDPNAFFDTDAYLSANPDVRAAGINPLEHFALFGSKEGRDPSVNFDVQLYLKANPDVVAAGSDPLTHYLQYGIAEGRQAYSMVGESIQNGFDADYYLLANPDVGAAGVDALFHFNTYGWKEGRDPNGWFDADAYLSTYTDVAAAGMNPLDHYMRYGAREGRDPSAEFDSSSYLSAYADVAAAGVNPLQHYLEFGIYEGRQSFADGSLIA